MKTSTRLGLLALTVSTLAMAVPARAMDMDEKATHRSIYFKGAIGLTKLQGMEYDINAGEVRNQYQKELSYSGAIGYDFGNYAMEMEYAYRTNDLDGQTLLGSKLADTEGDTQSSAFMINGYFETPTDSNWVPYLGVGAGIARVNLNDHMTGNILLVDDNATVFAYQGIAGLEYNVSRKISAFAEYRYFATADVPVTTFTGTNHDVDYESHNFMTGIKYQFQ